MSMESAPLKTWELSLYETKRKPQEAITDDTEIAVSPRALHSELMCPICLDILKQTMTTKECLHRFCQVCIITALRSGNKECPTCRKKLVSKRSLRHDPNFDQLIAKIYPSREEYEAHEQRVLAKLSKFTSSVPGADARPSLKKKSASTAGAGHDDGCSSLASDDTGRSASKRSRPNSDAAASSSVATPPPAKEFELLLKPVAGGDTKFLKTVCTATVLHLARYLCLRDSLDNAATAAAAAAAAAAANDEAAAAAAAAAATTTTTTTGAASSTTKESDVGKEAGGGGGAAAESRYAIFCKTDAGSLQRLSDDMSLEQIRQQFRPAGARPLSLFYESSPAD